MNLVAIKGRVTKDFEVKHLPSGLAVTSNAIAINKRLKTQEGGYKEVSSFFDFKVYGRTAEICAQYLRKGALILLQGELIQESWTDSTGNKKSKVLISATGIDFLESKKDAGQTAEIEWKRPQPYEQIPQSSSGYNVSDEEIPF